MNEVHISYHLLSTQAAIILLTAILLVQQASGSTKYQYKSLAGPATEFPTFAPPGLTSGMHSRYYVLPSLTLKHPHDNWTHSFPVDHCDILGIIMFAKDPKSYTIKFQSPSGDEVSANRVYDEKVGYGPAGLFPSRTFLFHDPIPNVGTWSIAVTSNTSSYPVSATFYASFYPSDLIMQAFIPPENLIVGKSIDIMALLPTEVSLGKTTNSTVYISALDKATTTIYLPDGREENVKLKEGPSGYMTNVKRDTGAKDLYASFEAPMEGKYKTVVQVDGVLSDGTNFIRSLWYEFTVVPPSVEVTGKVIGSLYTHDISERVKVNFSIAIDWDESDSSYRAFAQVWGTGEDNEEVPVAWISGLVEVQSREGCVSDCHYIEMELDTRWLELANAKPPLTLKSVTLDEMNTFITLSKSDAVEVIADDELMNWSPSLKAEDIEIDWEMKEGYNPYRVKKEDNTTETGQLLLLHGYCASGGGFLLDYFYNYLLFEDYEQTRLHDEFAKRVLDFIAEKGATRYSIVAHSQGGLVALHLYTYYQTGLDAVVSVNVGHSM